MAIRYTALYLPTARVIAPTSDISAGTWTASTGVNLYAMVDEVVPDDADYIISAASPVADTVRLRFASTTEPVNRDNHIVSYRMDTGGCTTVTVKLYSGATLVKTWTHSSVAAGINLYTQTLTNGEATTIGDYTDLEIEFAATA